MNTRTDPLSMAQRSLWNLERLGPGGPVYTLAWRVPLCGALDESAMREAFAAVVARHEPLRTRFEDENGPIAIVEDAVELPLPVDDLRPLSDAECAEEVTRRCTDDVGAGFALDRAPMLRARLLRLDDDRHDLLIIVHHIVFDGISLDLLLDELGHAYSARTQGDDPRLRVLGARYCDAVAEERELLTGPRRAASGAFWRERLRGAPPVVLPPPDREPKGDRSWAIRTCRRALPGPTVAAVSELARRERSTPYTMYFAVLNLLLSRLTGGSDVVVGTPVSGRHRSTFEQLIGYFVNTVPVRIQIDDRLSFRELARRVRGTMFDALDHQRLPFEAIVEEVRPLRTTGYTPLFQVLFSLQEPIRAEDNSFAGLAVGILEPVENGRSPFPLAVHVINRKQPAADLVFDYAPALYDEATAERMSAQFIELLTAALAAPETAVGELAAFVPVAAPTAAADGPAAAKIILAEASDVVIRAVQAVWSAHLRIDVTDPDADFVGLGGHSLAAARIAIDLRDLFGLEASGDGGISELTLFRAPTPRLLSGHLTAALGGPSVAAAEAEFVLKLLAMTDEQAEEQLAGLVREQPS
jgi:hypothetical protein